MKLYQAPTSPYARKCIVLLHETGQLDDVELVFATGSPLDASKMPLAQNPLGKIPALERPDGGAIYDSRVITRYLNDRADAAFYPESSIWETLTLEATADGILDAALLLTYEARVRPEEKQMAAFAEGQWEKISRVCNVLNKRWMAHLSGPMDIGHIAVGTALGYVDFRHSARDWRSENVALASWYAEFSKRPSMLATVPVDPK